MYVCMSRVVSGGWLAVGLCQDTRDQVNYLGNRTGRRTYTQNYIFINMVIGFPLPRQQLVRSKFVAFIDVH